ncbi:DNA-binding protein [Candidatus Micrarchaeota archaeon]|nr:DNA-binding protein [Candidatus Micrarchaeota archaeon]
MKVILDTNFLMLPVQKNVDIFEEVERNVDEKSEFIVLRSSLKELRALKGKDRLKARAMIQFIENNPAITIREEEGRTDHLIIHLAKSWKEKLIVGTNDRALKTRVKAAGAGVLVLRGNASLQKL